MLRIEFNHDGGKLIVRLQGRLIGAYAEHARIALERQQADTTVVVDLSDVTFVDTFGEQVLLWLGRLGASFVAGTVYTRSLCEDLRLRISDKRDDVTPGTDTEVFA
jgi:hypothetical protein